MSDLRSAGIHWPENANGEHPSVEYILSLPGIMQGAALICSPSARYWYRQLRGACPTVVWRAIPRQGKLPAQLDWIGKKVADECLNLWDEQPHGGIEHFTPLNELQAVKEAGEVFRSYAETASKLSNVRIALRQRFAALGQTVRLMFPAWVPTDDMDRLAEWQDEARQWDSIGLHCYGAAETMRVRYESYRAAFPHHDIFIGEWNANHEGHDERAALQMWAEVADTDPGLLGVTYYIWETLNAGEHDLSIWGNPDRLALFHDPPIVQPKDPEIPMIDPWQFWQADQIAAASECPPDAVSSNWPRLVAQLDLCGINDRQTQIAMIGTVAIESASSFRPVREAFYLGEPEPAETHRKTLAYYPFFGRGFIQLTWRENYATYGQKVNELWQAGGAIDLVARPDDALDPDVSAACSALYFRDHAGDGAKLIPQAAARSDWLEVRRLVYGGTDATGAARIRRIEQALGGGMTTTPVVYNRNEPAIPQNDPWSCAPTATRWAMTAVGRIPTESWMESQMIADGIVTEARGLLDGSGKHLAAWITQQYSEFGYSSNNEYPVTFDALAAEFLAPANPYPGLLGGALWNHWSGLRSYDPGRDVLLLANPDEHWLDVGAEMSRAEFAALGPMALVRVLHSDLVGGPIKPPVDPPIPPVTRADLEALLVEHEAQKRRIEALRDRLPV